MWFWILVSMVLAIPFFILTGFGLRIGVSIGEYAWERLWDWYAMLDGTFGRIGFGDDDNNGRRGATREPGPANGEISSDLDGD